MLTGTPDLGEAMAQFLGFADTVLQNGTGDNQADKAFSNTRSLAASATEDLDLAGGTLIDPLGAPVTFAKIRAIIVKAAVGNTNNVVIGGAAANAFVGPLGAANNTVAVPPGGAYKVSSPKASWPVTPGTDDLLRIANSGAGTSVQYDLILIGTSA